MSIFQYLFWTCLLLIIYTYCFYPIVLFIAYVLAQIQRDWNYLRTGASRRARLLDEESLPGVTLLIAAHNEEDCLPDKIANIRQLDYPLGKLQVVFASDGSTDRTNHILGVLPDSNIELIVLRPQKGKAMALKEAIARARHDIFVFSDASTLFAPDAIRYLVRHFTDNSVGVVCGALRFHGTLESQQTEGVYWKYEKTLRVMEARLGATLTASGAIYALRRDCYRPVKPTPIEDFVIPMNARKQGYRVLYDPEAVAIDFAGNSVASEFTRRARLAVGSFGALGELARTPLPGFSWLAFLSHKVLRWMMPFLFIGLLVTNSLLLSHPIYATAFVGQLLFYTWASIGFVFRDRLKGVRFALLGYFLIAMNLALLTGFLRYMAGREEGIWQRAN